MGGKHNWKLDLSLKYYVFQSMPYLVDFLYKLLLRTHSLYPQQAGMSKIKEKFQGLKFLSRETAMLNWGA